MFTKVKKTSVEKYLRLAFAQFQNSFDNFKPQSSTFSSTLVAIRNSVVFRLHLAVNDKNTTVNSKQSEVSHRKMLFLTHEHSEWNFFSL